MGRRNRPYYRIVVADSRARRDGKFIELVGSYDPMKPKKDRATINEERILHWLDKGAEPSDTVKNILSDKGLLLKAHLDSHSVSEEQKNLQLQKHELAKKARLKKEEPKKQAPVKEEPVAEEPVDAAPETETVESEPAAAEEEPVADAAPEAEGEEPAADDSEKE